MKSIITVLPGDGVGPEVTAQAVAVLKSVGTKYGLEPEFTYAHIGGAALDETVSPLPDETVSICKASDGILLGAVGGAKWDCLPSDIRPERGLLGIRSALGLYANLRPAIVHASLKNSSPLKPEIIGDALDLLIVRELTGGIYFGQHAREGDSAYDVERYSVSEIKRIGRTAFELAKRRKGRLCSVDKANVLESSRLWREVMCELSQEYPQVTLLHMYVDNAAMQLIRDPGQFDVIVTSNMFGDILSDEASQITGSIGMLPSASLGEGHLGLYEPIHGSAPDIAGKNIANPIAAILSAAMMLRHSLNSPEAADAIEKAVSKALEKGLRTADIARAGDACASTEEMTRAIISAL